MPTLKRKIPPWGKVLERGTITHGFRIEVFVDVKLGWQGLQFSQIKWGDFKDPESYVFGKWLYEWNPQPLFDCIPANTFSFFFTREGWRKYGVGYARQLNKLDTVYRIVKVDTPHPDAIIYEDPYQFALINHHEDFRSDRKPCGV